METDAAQHRDREPDERADRQAARAGQQVARAYRGHSGGPVLGIARGADRQDVELEQLEHHAQPQPQLDVAEDQPGAGPRDERPRDHNLRDADQVEPDQRPPEQQHQLDVEAHVNSPTGTARAVGTSWAVTSTPPAAMARSVAASASVR